MKYQFGRHNKKISSEEIKSHMNFDNVAKGAKAFVGIKLLSGVLKSSIGSTVTATVGTVATVAVVTVGANYLSPSEEALPQSPVQEQLLHVPEDSVAQIELVSPKQEVPTEALTTPKVVKEPVEKEEKAAPIAPQPDEPIENRDIYIEGRPLPNLQTFKAFINSELRYPERARKDSVEGFVRVYFKVNQKGIAEDFKIKKSLGKLFDQEAVRVLKQYQNWEPASFNGQAVESLFEIKVLFEFEKPFQVDTTKRY